MNNQGGYNNVNNVNNIQTNTNGNNIDYSKGNNSGGSNLSYQEARRRADDLLKNNY
jgi:hypothetical protein